MNIRGSTTWIMAAALVVALGGCGSEAVDGPGEDAAGGAPDDGGTVGGSGEWSPEYEAPQDILGGLRAGGVECEPGEVTSPTAYSQAAQNCHVGDDFYTAAVYASAAQQGDAQVTLSEMNPGTTFVWGTGWSVAVPVDSDGSEVVEVLGGEAETL